MNRLKLLAFILVFSLFEVYILNQVFPHDSSGNLIFSHILIAGILTLVNISSFTFLIFSFLVKTKYAFLFSASIGLFITISFGLKIYGHFSPISEVLLFLIIFFLDFLII